MWIRCHMCCRHMSHQKAPEMFARRKSKSLWASHLSVWTDMLARLVHLALNEVGGKDSPQLLRTQVCWMQRGIKRIKISVTKTWPAKYILNLGLCSSNVAAHHSIQCNSARLTASWRQSAVFTRNELKAYESYEASTGTVHMHTHKCTINYKHTHTHSFVLFIIRRVFIYIPIKENLYNTSQTIDKDIYGWTCV